MEVLKKEVPEARVRFCVRHMYANFHKQFKGLELSILLWSAARSIRSLNEDAYNWLMDVGKEERIGSRPGMCSI